MVESSAASYFAKAATKGFWKIQARRLGSVLRDSHAGKYYAAYKIVTVTTSMFGRMGLTESVDYARAVNIADHFRTWSIRGERWIKFSLARTAFGLLDLRMHTGAHDSLEDARVTMTLFQVKLRLLIKHQTQVHVMLLVSVEFHTFHRTRVFTTYTVGNLWPKILLLA